MTSITHWEFWATHPSPEFLASEACVHSSRSFGIRPRNSSSDTHDAITTIKVINIHHLQKFPCVPFFPEVSTILIIFLHMKKLKIYPRKQNVSYFDIRQKNYLNFSQILLSLTIRHRTLNNTNSQYLFVFYYSNFICSV